MSIGGRSVYRILSVALAAMLVSHHPNAVAACVEALTAEAGSDDFYKNVAYKTFAEVKSWLPEEIYDDYSPTDVLIGFDVGHTYFMVNGYKYDGALGLNVHRAKIRKRGTLLPGLVLRIKDLPPSAVQDLVQRLSQNQKPVSLTCSQGVCFYIRGAGVDLPVVESLIPSVFLQKILKNGVRMLDGRELTFDLVLLGRSSIKRSIRTSRIAEAVIGTLNPLVVGGGVWAYALLH